MFERKTCTEHGMFHQVRVDGGKEFYLCLGIQEIYCHLRSRQDITCYRQTQSKKVNACLKTNNVYFSLHLDIFFLINEPDNNVIFYLSIQVSNCSYYINFVISIPLEYIHSFHFVFRLFLILFSYDFSLFIKEVFFFSPYQNLPIERFWPEVNIRVNYPIKRALVEMDNDQVINMGCEVQKFCVSSVSCSVAKFGIDVVVKSWNAHTIPGSFV